MPTPILGLPYPDPNVEADDVVATAKPYLDAIDAHLGAEPQVYSTIIYTSSLWNNQNYGEATNLQWHFTPSRSGIATASLALDVSSGSAGWSAFFVRILRNGAVCGVERSWFEGAPRTELMAQSHPFRVRAGEAVNLGAEVHVYSSSGAVRLNNGGAWTATVTPA